MTTSMTMSQMTMSSSRVPFSVSRLDTTADTRSSNTFKRVFSTSALVSTSKYSRVSSYNRAYRSGACHRNAGESSTALATFKSARCKNTRPRNIVASLALRLVSPVSAICRGIDSVASAKSAALRSYRASLVLCASAWLAASITAASPACAGGMATTSSTTAARDVPERRVDATASAARTSRDSKRALPSALSSALERKLGLGDGRSNRSREKFGSSGSACAKNIASTSTSSAANGSISHASSKSRVANRSSSAVKPQNTTMPYSKKNAIFTSSAP